MNSLFSRASPNSGALPVPSLPNLDPSPIPLDPEVEELWSSRALLLSSWAPDGAKPQVTTTPTFTTQANDSPTLQVLILLILSFFVSYHLKIKRIRSVHETIIALFAGMCAGLLVRIAPGDVVQNMISFKSTILLNVLLPPIILNSGYQLKQENFFRNFGVILTFAFAGTFISAVVLGVIVYVYSLLGLEGFSLTIIECLLFGSTLSATDPVTILAIFNALHVDPKLYSVIFGESILNDAVAIVMFETLSQFHGEKIHVLSFFHGAGIFLLTFCISMALGVMFGLACSLMLKHSELGRYTEIESCLVFLIAYTSYFFSNALTMSGIVSLLFCGITLKHYAYHNMSRRTQRTSRYTFSMLAQLSENFIFIYLGLSLFTSTKLVYKPLFILVTAFAVCIARWCAVFPISKIINVWFKARGQRADELPHSYQMMLYWAGLRGAVGVALAQGLKGDNAVALRTTVLVAVVLTVVVFGGTIGRMIEILGIRTGVVEDDEDGDETDDEDGGVFARDGIEAGLTNGNGGGRRKRGSTSKSGKKSGAFGGNAMEMDEDDVVTPYRDQRFDSSGGGLTGGKLGSNVRAGGDASLSPRHGRSLGSDVSTGESEESDPDILPSITAEGNAGSGGVGDLSGEESRVWRDGQWFTVLDERYLLPVFSNATASRRQASKKALRAKRAVVAGVDDDPDDLSSPYGAPSTSFDAQRPSNASFADIISSLVSPSVGTFPASSTSAGFGNVKARQSIDEYNDDEQGTIDLNTVSGTGRMGLGNASKRGSWNMGVGGAEGSQGSSSGGSAGQGGAQR